MHRGMARCWFVALVAAAGCLAASYLPASSRPFVYRPVDIPPGARINCFGCEPFPVTWRNTAVRFEGGDCSLVRSVTFTQCRITGDMREAILFLGGFRGCDLTAAYLTGTNMPECDYDRATRWPAGFDPQAHGARLVE